MFVLFGFDDNGYADGILWFRNLVKDLKNPDGTPVRATFFCNGIYGDNDQEVLAAWQALADDGHEIGNHTWDHPHGTGLSPDQWSKEISDNTTFLSKNLSINANQIKGFRTPFLEYTPSTMTAVVANGLQYDCSIEFGYNGWQPDVGDPDYPPATSGLWWNSMSSSKTFQKLFWPYTLDKGSPPGNSAIGNPVVAGLWEIPVYTYLRADTTGVVTGFDFNLWTNSTRAYFAATLEKNFDLRYTGNRSPLLISAHTDYYTKDNEDAETAFPNAHWQDRRGAIEDILTYVRKFPDVRIVPISNMFNWMKNPTPLSPTSNKNAIAPKAAMTKIAMKFLSKKAVGFSVPANGAFDLLIINSAGTVLQKSRATANENSVVFPMGNLHASGYFLFTLKTKQNVVFTKTAFVE